MSSTILKQLNIIVEELDNDGEFLCAAHIQMAIDRLSNCDVAADTRVLRQRAS